MELRKESGPCPNACLCLVHQSMCVLLRWNEDITRPISWLTIQYMSNSFSVWYMQPRIYLTGVFWHWAGVNERRNMKVIFGYFNSCHFPICRWYIIYGADAKPISILAFLSVQIRGVNLNNFMLFELLKALPSKARLWDRSEHAHRFDAASVII